jgi:hypothetical protein
LSFDRPGTLLASQPDAESERRVHVATLRVISHSRGLGSLPNKPRANWAAGAASYRRRRCVRRFRSGGVGQLWRLCTVGRILPGMCLRFMAPVTLAKRFGCAFGCNASSAGALIIRTQSRSSAIAPFRHGSFQEKEKHHDRDINQQWQWPAITSKPCI